MCNESALAPVSPSLFRHPIQCRRMQTAYVDRMAANGFIRCNLHFSGGASLHERPSFGLGLKLDMIWTGHFRVVSDEVSLPLVTFSLIKKPERTYSECAPAPSHHGIYVTITLIVEYLQ